MKEPYITPNERVVVGDWTKHPSGGYVSALPWRDLETGLFARLSYRQQLELCDKHGMRLMTLDQHRALARNGHYIRPVQLWTPTLDMRCFETCRRHDELVNAYLIATRWNGTAPVANVGKHFLDEENGARVIPPRCVNVGWSKREGSDRFTQEPGHHHDADYTDYSQLFQPWVASVDGTETEETPTMTRSTIRKGSRGTDVAAWQAIVGADPDGSFGSQTEAFTKAWQANHSLVADGVVGPKTWLAAGENPARSASRPESAACLAALRDANARWPNRKRASDGIMGDASHQASRSDHNVGLAVDITHDPSSGCDGNAIAEQAILDSRVTYVIWNRRIFNRARAADGWRKYTGANAHNHHCHISVHVDSRDDDRPWGWA